LNKKFLAIAITALMIIGLFPALTWTPQAHAQEECELFGDSPMCVFLNPGIADDFKIGWSHTLDTLWGTQDGALFPPPGSPEDNAQTRQLFDNYLDYAILARSTGDLQFTLNIVEEIGGIRMYIPPEFTFLAPTMEESVWTDITNDYSFSAYFSAPRWAYDPTAPGWTRIDFGVDYYGTNTLVIEPGMYHIRLFNLQAPSVAGLYHFKIRYIPVNAGYTLSIGAGNYPIIIVKDELNPAWIAATVRTNLGFTPPYVSGRVTAEGSTPEGRSVSAVGYFGPYEWLGDSFVPGQTGAEYRTYLFGVAEGSYSLKAEASGFVPTTTERITVLAGQSYHIGPIVLFDSPDVHVTVWSKHGTGETPWHNLWQLPYGTNNPTADPDDTGPRRDILLELYNTDNEMVAFWASNVLAALGDTKSIPETNKLIGWHDDAPGGTMPTATSYNAWLVDNFDVEGNARGYPSTVWDGHVPWDTADYISGLTNAQYSVEAFVTGYIMDESDAYQRTFSLSGSSYNLQFDLRRSNWIEVAMHLPANLAVSAETTVTLTAEDSGANERASVAFFAYPEMCDDGVIDGTDADFATASTPNWQYYEGGIVMEGWNAVFPAAGGARGDFRDISRKDYGLNPTASTHSAGAVTLAGNPYSVKLYMADMGLPYADVAGTGWYSILGSDPQLSVFLCNSPQSLSFSIAPAWLWISLRSVDFEIPAHSRPWTFPGAYVWVDFLDESGTAVGQLDPTLYGLIQDPGRTNAGFDIIGAPANSYGVSPFDIDNVNEAGFHEHLGVTFYGQDFCSSTWGGAWGMPFALTPGWRSTRLPAGQYTYNVHTLGYVMRRSFPVQVPASGGADIEADLIQGAQIRVTFNFKNEGIPTDFNGFARVEVFNENDELVGASIYGQANTNQFLWGTTPGGAYLRYSPYVDNMNVPGPAEGADLGLPTSTFPSSDPLYSNGQRANWYSYYGVPGNPPGTGTTPTATAGRWPCLTPGYVVGGAWQCSVGAPYAYHGWSQMQPSDANRLIVAAGGAQSFDVFGFHLYSGGPARTWAGGWPTTDGLTNMGADRDIGLKGSMDIPGLSGSGGGNYKVKVWAFDGPGGSFDSASDWSMYQMAWPLENVEVPWGGSVELFVTMNNMATLRGSVEWLDMFGNVRALPWAQVTASPGSSTDQIPAYAAGLATTGGASETAGAYIMWLPAGSHDVSVSTSEAPQVWSSSAPTQNAQYTVVVSDGWVGGGDSRLASNEGVPVPELPAFAVPLSLFAALAASVWLLRKRTLNVPILTK
jgi:hypothetical protein